MLVGKICAKMKAPTLSPPLVRLFTRYSRGYVRRHFHSVRLLKSHALLSDFAALPAVVFLNHASWWDPLLCLLLAQEFFPSRGAFGPIDARALQRYPFLAKIGFFPVENDSARGAANFLRSAEAILGSNERMLWVTPQGRFTDARARPITIQRGVAHLAARVAPAVFVPLALEYTFWEERTPEILIAFGAPLFTQNHRDSCGADDWTSAIEQALTDAQDALAAAAQRRDAAEWEPIFAGRSGTTPLYDLWRRARATWRGEHFRPEHSTL